jgi:hypothetical protein
MSVQGVSNLPATTIITGAHATAVQWVTMSHAMTKKMRRTKKRRRKMPKSHLSKNDKTVDYFLKFH